MSINQLKERKKFNGQVPVIEKYFLGLMDVNFQYCCLINVLLLLYPITAIKVTLYYAYMDFFRDVEILQQWYINIFA